MPKFDKTFLHSFTLFRVVSVFCVFAVLMAAIPQPGFAQQQNAQDLPVPPRIGMVSGTASFWRPGAENWSPAQVNIGLAAGDALYTAATATLEVQIGSRAYVRLAQNTMLTLLGNEPGLQQFKMTSGIAAFDLRSLPAGHSVEIDTPSAAFNIDSAGYYRLEITDTTTHFVVRRGGEATVTLPDGDSRLIAPSQEAVIDAGGQGNVETYVAPDIDTWDQWNYTRTDDLIEAISNRYVSPEVYGTDDLDHNGNWRVTPDYGPVWVPNGMAPDWAPYSSGSWVWDPVYAWTWVDAAPWGWAPYHYGRWVNINGFWAWAPGPRHHHPAYAPALVAFFHGNGGGMQIGFGGPAVSWVALGWGEPCLPWWGRRGLVGRPWWGGWAGPRVVNNVVIQHNTIINNVTNIRYRNSNQHNAVIAMPEKEFGHGRVADTRRLDPAHVRELRPISGQHPLRPEAASFAPSAARSAMPAASVMNRPAVALHGFPQRAMPQQDERHDRPQAQQTLPDKVITVRPQQTGKQAPWARFGQSVGPERNEPRRAPDPPRAETWSSPLQIRQENTVTKPPAPEQARPMPQQQPPVRIIEAPQIQRREQEPARIMNVPPQIPVIRPVVPEQVRPTPQQQQPPRIIDTPQLQRREQEPARIITAPPPAPVIMQREAPRMPVVAPPQAEHPMQRPEQAPQNARPEVVAPMPPGEIRREHIGWPREGRQQEAPASLPGQPANRLYQRRLFPRSEQQR